MLRELLSIWESFIRNLDGASGRWIRYQYYRRRFAACGHGVRIDTGVVFQSPGHMFLGNNVWIDRYTILLAGPFVAGDRKFSRKLVAAYTRGEGELHLADGVHVAPFVVLQAHGGLSIGSDVTVASGAKVYTLSHHYRNLQDATDSKRYHFSSMADPSNQYLVVAPIVIENGAAIGLNSVLLPGTHIRKGTWVGTLTQVSPGETAENDVIKAP